MGLPERRALKEFQEKLFPGLKKEVEEAAGFAVPVEVQWDTLAAEGYAHLYGEAWPKVYFRPLVGALKSITADDLGREALGKALKKIVIANTKGNHSAGGFTFEGGELAVDHEPCSNLDDVKDCEEGLRALLEKGL